MTPAARCYAVSPTTFATYARHGLACVCSALGGVEGQGMFDYDLLDRVRDLRVPTVLIGSRTDTLWSQHARVHPVIPRGREYVFDTVNPLYQFDRPERASEYAQTLRSFL